MNLLSNSLKNYIDSFSDVKILAILILVALIIRLPFISYVPFVTDESTYSIMISEQMEKVTLIPTFFGYTTFWKPILFYWVYAFFANFLKALPITIEAVYRLPTELFGLINIVLFYYLLKNLGVNKTTNFLTSLVYTLIFLNIYISNTVFVDTMLNTFILGALYFYTKEKKSVLDYALAFFLSFGAYYVKLITAFIIPVLAIAYQYFKDKKGLVKPVFLLSLLAVPSAMILQYYIYSDLLKTDTFKDSYSKELFDRLALQTIFDKISGTWQIFEFINMWLVFGIAGLWFYYKENKFMAFWMLMFFVTILTNEGYFWYYITVLPPIAYFSVMLLSEGKKENYDKLFKIIFVLVLIMSFAIGFLALSELKKPYDQFKKVGEFSIGKANVNIYGVRTNTAVAYKVLEEKRMGNQKDFGWILIPTHSSVSEKDLQGLIQEYNYSSRTLNVTDGSFSRMYWDNNIFRKYTNITKPEYLVFANLDVLKYNLTINGTVLLEDSYVKVIRVR